MARKRVAARRQRKPGKRPTSGTKAGRAKTAAVSPAFQELIGRALTDHQFRTLLYRNRARAIRGLGLTAADRRALHQLKKSELDKQARALGSRAAWTVKVAVSVKF